MTFLYEGAWILLPKYMEKIKTATLLSLLCQKYDPRWLTAPKIRPLSHLAEAREQGKKTRLQMRFLIFISATLAHLNKWLMNAKDQKAPALFY